MFLIGDFSGGGIPPGDPPGTFPWESPEGFLQGILSYLESPPLNVALQEVGFIWREIKN